MTAIAIVGMGCRFADAPDLQSYWDMTLAGTDAFGPPPADRWDPAVFHSTSRRSTDKSYAPHGAFIKDVRSFPALAFGLPPRRVEVMDPQQRFALEVSLQAIEDAGYRAPELPRRTGVFMGVTASEYRSILSSRVIAQYMATGGLGEAPDDAGLQAIVEAVNRVVPSRPFTAPGVLQNMISATVAQELDLHGPAFTTDAACASAMVALSSAVAHLRSGAVDAALAGGVYLCLTPEHHIAFSRIGAMSASGYCRPFDARADGFVQGDGAGALLLKRLDDAVRDGDRVYAVIHGIALNNDGKGDGPMAPLSQGQAEVIQAAWHDAGMQPNHVGYLEAHGTGTSVGDANEIQGLRKAFGAELSNVCLGSSKANVGHTMSAAAIAGVIRSALAIHHGVIPPMAGFASPRADLSLQEAGLTVPRQATPWTAALRLAGVSSFGFGGTNGHAVLGGVDPTSAPHAEQVELLLVSGPSEVEVRALCGRTAATMRTDPRLTVAGVARAWAARRPQPFRLAVVATSRSALLAALDGLASGERPNGTTVGLAPDVPPRLAFLYPGQGSQRLGMLRDIAARFPAAASTLDGLQAALGDTLPVPLTQLLWPETRSLKVDDATALAELTLTENCQPALLACGLALTALLKQVGVTPHVVLGHSLGEFTAAVVSGCLPAEEGVRFVAQRGALMASHAGDSGAMAALSTDEATARSFLAPGAVVANINHPSQVVVAGATGAVAATVTAAESAGVKAIALEVSHGFHSPVFEDLDVAHLVAPLSLTAPTVTMASGIADHPYETAADARAVFSTHATSPVQFTRALEQCQQAGADIYLQVGAGGPLAAFTRGQLRGQTQGIYTLASTADDDGGASLLTGLARLWIAGVSLDVRPLLAAGPVGSVPPATYAREAYWAVKDDVQLSLGVTGATPRERAAPAPAPVAPATPVPTRSDADPVETAVLAIVAKVSAYPLASLRPGMSLLDDLGFDSLMVNDLASGLADAFPTLPGIPQELLLNRPSVQDLIDFVRRSDGTATAVNDDEPLTPYTPTWVPTPLPSASQRRVHGSLKAHVTGTSAVAEGLRAHLSALGALAEPPAADLWIDARALDHIPETVADTIADPSRWPDLAGSLLTDAAALGDSAPQAMLVLRWDDDPWAHASAGATRALAREWPKSRVKCLALDRAIEPEQAVAKTIAEWLSSDTTVDVRLRPGGRDVGGLSPLPRRAPRDWTPADVVLITGGTRGIGAEVGEALASLGATVLLLGRSSPGETASRAIASAPDRVRALSADVTDLASMTAAVGTLGVTHLVHAAGVLADGPTHEVAASSGQLARQVKAGGWLHAVRAAGPTLRSAVSLGSWAGRFGNRHQAHYASANALLSGLAQHAPSQLAAAVVELGPWTDSEMARSIPPAMQAAMRADGVDFVGPAAGLGAILDALAGQRGPLVMGRDLPSTTRRVVLEQRISTADAPYLLDHQVDGRPVLPLAAATDLLVWAADVQAPFEIIDVELFKGIEATQAVRLELGVDGDSVSLRQGDARSLAYTARVRPLAEMPIDPGPRPGGTPGSLPLAEFYRDITFHGPLLQGITAIEAVGDDFIRGRVRTSRPTDWIPGSPRAAWAVDPLVLDAVMQLSGYVAYTRLGRAGTPVRIGRYRQLAPFPPGELACEVTFDELDESSDLFSGTLWFRSLEGQLLAFAEGVTARLVKVNTSAEDIPPIDPAWIDAKLWPGLKDIELRLDGAVALGIRNPYFAVHEGTARNRTQIGGREYINFSSYNYLGLSGDPDVLRDVTAAVAKYGTSVSASRVASGERPFHAELERKLADCQGSEDALLFTAGHATNVTTVGHIMGPDDLVLHDEFIHDSVLQGVKLSGSARRTFRHDDPAHLEQQLRELRAHYKKVLIVVEGVYSMDGDVCSLPAYIRIKKTWGCLLMVDEAHSFGVVGATGQGVREHFDIDGRDVDLWMGTLSKSLASCGGWIAASSAIIKYLRYTAPGFVYSAGLTPANGVAALSSLDKMLADPARVQTLQANALFFHDELAKRGLDTGPARGESAVVPLITKNSFHALHLSQRLADSGVNVQPIVYPAVADDAARLRFFLSSTHTRDELTETAKLCEQLLGEIREQFPIPA